MKSQNACKKWTSNASRAFHKLSALRASRASLKHSAVQVGQAQTKHRAALAKKIAWPSALKRIARFGVSTLSSVAMIVASFSTPALAEAKEKMGNLDLTPLTLALSATQDKFVSSIKSDMNEHCALPPETNVDYTAYFTNNSDSASATDTASVPESTTIDSYSKTLSTDRNSLAYAVKSGTGRNITLTFQYGAQPSSGDWWQIADTYTASPGWAYSQATTVTFDESFKDYTPTSTAYWFDHLSSLKTINNISYLNTTNVTNMRSMFSNCSVLTSLSLPNTFDTSRVEYMSYMFYSCSKLTSLTLPDTFNTSSVEYMNSMFYNCSKLTSLTLPDTFNTSSVEYMNYMFSDCSALTSLTLPAAFATSSVADMYGMFGYCFALTSLTLPAAFDTSKVTNMSYMFYDCSALKTLTLGKKALLQTGTMLPGLENSTNPFWIKDIQTAVSYNTTEADAVANINAILCGLSDTETQTFTKATMRLTYDANQGYFPEDPEPATPVTEAYLYGNPGDKISDSSATPAFNYTPVPVRENYNYLGYAASATATTAATPTEFPAAGSNTIFYAIWTLPDGPYVVKSGTGANITLTFQYGAQPSSGTQGTDWWQIEDTYSGAPGWSSSGATTVTFDGSFKDYTPTSTAYWFYYLTKVTTINNLLNLNTTNVTDMSYMFDDCIRLTSLTLPDTFNTSNVEYMTLMFQNCSALTSLTLPAAFDTSSVKDMNSMFYNCTALTSLTLPAAFDTSSVEDMVSMFRNCTALTSLTLPAAFDTGKVAYMTRMFFDCSALTSLSLPTAFDTSSVEDMSYMFANCTRLTSLTLPAAFDTGKVEDMYVMFGNCAALTSLTLPTSFDTSKVENMGSMFYGCSALTSLTLPAAFDTRNVDDMEAMFNGCSALTSLTLSKDFVFQDSTAFPFGGTAPGNFWIPNKTTRMEDTYDKWNSYLASLPDTTTVQTFHIANRTYTFAANGGAFATGDEASSSISFYGNEGDALGSAPTPQRTGYAQNGWWTEAEEGTQVTIPSVFGPDPEVSVYAHWKEACAIVPTTGDPLSGNFMAIFLASIVAAGMTLLLSCRVSRKGESE